GLDGEQVEAEFVLERIMDEDAAWELALTTRGLDPALWLADAGMSGRIRADIRASGRGFVPGAHPWRAEVNLDGSEWQGVAIASWRSGIRIVGDSLWADSDTRIDRSALHLVTGVSGWMDTEPRYHFALQAADVNLAEFVETGDFSTAVNMSLTG